MSYLPLIAIDLPRLRFVLSHSTLSRIMAKSKFNPYIYYGVRPYTCLIDIPTKAIFVLSHSTLCLELWPRPSLTLKYTMGSGHTRLINLPRLRFALSHSTLCLDLWLSPSLTLPIYHAVQPYSCLTNLPTYHG